MKKVRLTGQVGCDITQWTVGDVPRSGAAAPCWSLFSADLSVTEVSRRPPADLMYDTVFT